MRVVSKVTMENIPTNEAAQAIEVHVLSLRSDPLR